MRGIFILVFFTICSTVLSQKKSDLIGNWDLKYIYDSQQKKKKEFPICNSYINFTSDTTFSAYGCCNTRISKYHKTKGGGLKLFIGERFMTMVDCSDERNKMDDAIIPVLSAAEKYLVNEDSLILYSGSFYELHYTRSKKIVHAIQKPKTKKKTEKQQLLQSDSMSVSNLGVKGISPTLGNFNKNDTIFYPDKSICRISRANKHGLNGRFEYFYKNGIKQCSFKYKNNNRCDTSYFYFREGDLLRKEIIIDKYSSIIQEYYRTGQLGHEYKTCVDKHFRDTGEFDWSKKDSPQTMEYEQYYDKEGNKISGEEFHKLYNGGRK